MEKLKEDLRKLGAREFEILLLMADPERAFQAIDAAQEYGADNIIRYALTLFGDRAWQPGRAKLPTLATAAPHCETCDDHRLVLVETHPVAGSPVEDAVTEAYAPCPDCNPIPPEKLAYRRFDGSLRRGLDSAKVREMMRK